MNDLEDRLRRDLRTQAQQAQPETIRPLRAPVPGRRAHAARWLAPVMAMVAVAGIVAGVNLAERATGTSPAAAARPGIYVTVTQQYLLPVPEFSGRTIKTDGAVATATVRDASTGAALTSLQLWPARPEHPRGPAGGLAPAPLITGAADDRTFAISDQGGLFLLHVTSDGRSAHLTRIPVRIANSASSAPALSPDGTKLAVDVESCPGHDRACVEGIEILSVATRSRGTGKVWLGPSMAGMALSPAWTDNGREVMFEWSIGSFRENGYRLLSPTAASGGLLAVSRPVPYPPAGLASPPQAVLTPDGRGLIVVTSTFVHGTGGAGVVINRIADLSPQTGRLLKVLLVVRERYTNTHPVLLPYPQCTVLSLAPKGLHLLIECPGFGRLDGTKFTRLPSGSAHSPGLPAEDAAW